MVKGLLRRILAGNSRDWVCAISPIDLKVGNTASPLLETKFWNQTTIPIENCNTHLKSLFFIFCFLALLADLF